MTRIYHLARRSDWDAAQDSGPYRGGAADKADGFIHFSTAARLAESAALYCAGVADLMVVAVDAESLGAALCWEEARDGEAFPHLYGPLPTDSVLWVEAAPLDAEGRHRFPELT